MIYLALLVSVILLIVLWSYKQDFKELTYFKDLNRINITRILQLEKQLRHKNKTIENLEELLNENTK